MPISPVPSADSGTGILQNPRKEINVREKKIGLLGFILQHGKVKTHYNGAYITFRRTFHDPNTDSGIWIEKDERISGYGDFPVGVVTQTHTTQPLIVPKLSPGKAAVSIHFKIYNNPLQRFFNWPVLYNYSAPVNIGKR